MRIEYAPGFHVSGLCRDGNRRWVSRGPLRDYEPVTFGYVLEGDLLTLSTETGKLAFRPRPCDDCRGINDLGKDQ